jgi:hypothetical protein
MVDRHGLRQFLAIKKQLFKPASGRAGSHDLMRCMALGSSNRRQHFCR